MLICSARRRRQCTAVRLRPVLEGSAFRWSWLAFRCARFRCASILVLLAIVSTTIAPRTVRATIRSLACGRASAVAHPRPFVLQTLNVFGLPWFAGTDVEKRCTLIADSIIAQEPDFVALQEVWDERSREPLLVSGYEAAYCDPARGLLEQNGLLTLSRLPILETSVHRFSDSSGLESWISKGALRTMVRAPNGDRLAIWNVHLQSGVDEGSVRRGQILELASWIESAHDECSVVAGDLNCSEGDPEWALLVQVFGARGLVPRSGRIPTYDHGENPLAAIEPPATIDHVFVNARRWGGSLIARRIHDHPVEGVWLSDHFGLEVTLVASTSEVQR